MDFYAFPLKVFETPFYDDKRLLGGSIGTLSG